MSTVWTWCAHQRWKFIGLQEDKQTLFPGTIICPLIKYETGINWITVNSWRTVETAVALCVTVKTDSRLQSASSTTVIVSCPVAPHIWLEYTEHPNVVRLSFLCHVSVELDCICDKTSVCEHVIENCDGCRTKNFLWQQLLSTVKADRVQAIDHWNSCKCCNNCSLSRY